VTALVVRRGMPELAASPPSPLFLLGAVAGLLFAIWAIVAPILERKQLNAIRDDSLAIVRFMLCKSRNSLLVILSAALAAAAFFVVVGVFADDGGTGGRVALFVFAGICVLAAAAMGRGAWRLRNPSKAPLMHTLKRNPTRIVWVYVNQVIVYGISSFNIFVCRDDGRRYELHLRQLDPQLALAALKDRLPKAAFGFSEELEEEYRRSPGSFARANDGAVARWSSDGSRREFSRLKRVFIASEGRTACPF